MDLQPLLYCPYCTDPMIPLEGTLCCLRGAMCLSHNLRDLLIAAVKNQPVVKNASSACALPLSSRLHCPRCTAAVAHADDIGLHMICPECGLTMNNAITYQLIEIHPHR